MSVFVDFGISRGHGGYVFCFVLCPEKINFNISISERKIGIIGIIVKVLCVDFVLFLPEFD